MVPSPSLQLGVRVTRSSAGGLQALSLVRALNRTSQVLLPPTKGWQLGFTPHAGVERLMP
jgi:hypothetical protein